MRDRNYSLLRLETMPLGWSTIVTEGGTTWMYQWLRLRTYRGVYVDADASKDSVVKPVGTVALR